MIIKSVIFTILCFALSVAICHRMREAYTHREAKDELIYDESFGALIISFMFSAVFGAFIKLELSLVLIGVLVAAAIIWLVALWFWKEKSNHKKHMLKICQRLSENFRLARMLGMASIMTVVLLPLFRLVA